MGLSIAEKKRIAGRAQGLHERLETPSSGEAGERVEDVDEWVAEWQDRVASGDVETFRERLDLADIEPEECRRRLRSHAWPESEPLPGWVHGLDELVEYVESRDSGGTPVQAVAEEDVPFTHLLTVFVEYASGQVDWSIAGELLSEQAVANFERRLLDRLEALFAHTLFIEFKTFLATRDRELALADDPEMPSSPRRHYDEFVERFHHSELASLFVEYAVLARLTVTVIEQWVETVEEFESRLAADRQAVASTFGGGGCLGTVEGLDFRGDPHHGGRTVVHVSFASGTEVGYKPRPVDNEMAFYELLSRLNAETTLPDLRTLAGLDKGEYGWVEWVQTEECSTTEAVSRYYRRAGVLLGLLYALNFTDGHLENIVAEGDQPVVVDMETLAHPDLTGRNALVSGLGERIQDSILRTQFLPLHSSDSDGMNLGGLGVAEADVDRSDVDVPSFENVNTDVMELEYEDPPAITGESLPTLDGEPVRPDDHYEDLVDGFERAHRFLADNREAFVGDGGHLARFEGGESRFLPRSTDTYAGILVPLTTPSYLRTGLKFGCKLEVLAEGFADGRVDRDLWPLYEAERTALWRLDVPRFTIETTDTRLRHGARSIGDVFEVAPLEQVRRRVLGLDDADLREQLDYLALAYSPQQLSHPEPPSPRVESESWTADPEPLERAAREVFDRLWENASRTRDGDVVWHFREHRAEAAYVHRLIDDLYGGRIGVAVFTAALARVFEETEYRQATAEIVAPLLDELDGEDPFSEMKVGGGHGVGSLVYGFTKLAELLEDDRYDRAARRSASLLTPDRFAEDSVFDTIGGSAGGVLGLLALHERTGASAALERAVVGGDHLLDGRIEADGVRVWLTTNDERPVAGVSHGIAGIAYALFRLADATGETRFRDAALESIEYERERYSPERQNWPDLRLLTDSDFVPGWCSGRAGIGLTRLEMSVLDDDESLRADARRALRGFEPRTLHRRDHPCCGNAGRVEFLFRAGRTLDRPDYRERARELAHGVVRRTESGESGRFTVPWQTSRWYNPTFFTGEPGVAYTLLRVTNPDLPCVLLWE